MLIIATINVIYFVYNNFKVFYNKAVVENISNSYDIFKIKYVYGCILKF